MKKVTVLLYHYFAGISRNLSPLHTDHACKVQCVIPLRQKDKKKSEPISDLENLVRIILIWCGKQDWILTARRRSVSAVLKPHWGLIHYGFFKSVSRVYKKEARRFRRAFFCGAGNRT